MMNSVKILNDYISKTREQRHYHTKGHLVNKTTINKKMGQYNEYVYELYFIDNNADAHLIHSFSKILAGQKEDNLSIMDDELLTYIYDVLYSHPTLMDKFIMGVL